MCDQYDDGRIDTGERLPGALFVTAYQLVAGRLKPVRAAADTTKNMPVLPVMQSLCVGQHPGVFGVHVHGCAAQIDELCLRMPGQDFFSLDVVDGNREEITLAIGAEQGGGLDCIQVSEFAGFQVDGYLAFIRCGQQAPAVP